MNSKRPTEYERKFSELFQEDVSVYAFWKGRVALYAILKALEIGAGDEVIMPAFTCVVVPNAVRYAKASPIYVDIPPQEYNIGAGEIEDKITPKTRAIIIQHTFGIPADIKRILVIAHARGIPVIEDCAHALGTKVGGKQVGLFGDAAFFSSQWSKPITTGLGGLAITHNPEIAHRLQKIQAGFVQPSSAERHSLNVQYQIYKRFFSPQIYWIAREMLHQLGRIGLFVGSSSASELDGAPPTDHEWQMPDYQQAVGLKELVRLDEIINQKIKLAEQYDRALAAEGWSVNRRPEWSVLLRYPVRVGNKTDLLNLARINRIELGSWFETPLHPIPLKLHAKFDFESDRYPNSIKASDEVVNLPLHEKVSLQEAERITKFLFRYGKPNLIE